MHQDKDCIGIVVKYRFVQNFVIKNSQMSSGDKDLPVKAKHNLEIS